MLQYRESLIKVGNDLTFLYHYFIVHVHVCVLVRVRCHYMSLVLVVVVVMGGVKDMIIMRHNHMTLLC